MSICLVSTYLGLLAWLLDHFLWIYHKLYLFKLWSNKGQFVLKHTTWRLILAWGVFSYLFILDATFVFDRDSIPSKFRPLEGRLNIVLTSEKDLPLPAEVLTSTSLNEGRRMRVCVRTFVVSLSLVLTNDSYSFSSALQVALSKSEQVVRHFLVYIIVYCALSAFGDVVQGEIDQVFVIGGARAYQVFVYWGMLDFTEQHFVSCLWCWSLGSAESSPLQDYPLYPRNFLSLSPPFLTFLFLSISIVMDVIFSPLCICCLSPLCAYIIESANCHVVDFERISAWCQVSPRSRLLWTRRSRFVESKLIVRA